MTRSSESRKGKLSDGASQLSSAASAVQATQLELSRLLRHAKSNAGIPSQSAVDESNSGKMAARTLKDYEDLQEDYSVLEEQHYSQIESAESKLLEAQQQIHKLKLEVDRQRRDKEDVSRVLARTQRNLGVERQRSQKFLEASNKLRQLLSHSVQESESEKRKRVEVAAFFKRLGDFNSSVLDASTPPTEFEFLEVEPAHALEVEKLRVAVNKLKMENSELKSRIEALLKEKVTFKSATKKRMNKAEGLASSKQTQLIGALRRIKYLVKEQAAMRKQKDECEQYIMQLENKLLELNDKLRSREDRQKVRDRRQRQQARRKVEALRSRFSDSNGSTPRYSQGESRLPTSPLPSPIRQGTGLSSPSLEDSTVDEKFAEWQQRSQIHSNNKKQESKVWDEDMVLPELEDDECGSIPRTPHSAPR